MYRPDEEFLRDFFDMKPKQKLSPQQEIYFALMNLVEAMKRYAKLLGEAQGRKENHVRH